MPPGERVLGRDVTVERLSCVGRCKRASAGGWRRRAVAARLRLVRRESDATRHTPESALTLPGQRSWRG